MSHTVYPYQLASRPLLGKNLIRLGLQESANPEFFQTFPRNVFRACQRYLDTQLSVRPVPTHLPVALYQQLGHLTDPSDKASGLVKKIETSRSSRNIKGTKQCRKSLMATTQEHQRYARSHDLRAVSLTLTYAEPKHYSSKHISDFLEPQRSAMRRKKLKLCYIWRLERSPDGLLHYHVMLWLKRGEKITKPCLEQRWPYGCTQIEATRSPSAWTKYISKCSKLSGHLPKGARGYGRGGLDEAGTQAVRRALFPLWLKKRVPVTESAKRVKNLGWVNTVSGEVLISPYIWTGSGCVLRDSCRDVTMHPPGLP